MPSPALAPAVETVAADRVRVVARREVGSGRARAQPPEDPIDLSPVVHPLLTAYAYRQMRFDHHSFRIRQVKPRHPRTCIQRTDDAPTKPSQT